MCTDRRHQGSTEWRDDHFMLRTLRLGLDSSGELVLYDDIFAQGIPDSIFTGDFSEKPAVFYKGEIHPDGSWTMVIRCTCSRDVQRNSRYLADRATQLFAASPDATRVDFPITTL